ncbi:MAG: efflux RND transporter periplasmic adaptor subunit [Hyphomonas sp.]|uniref:efflux RND transporter periplasmic adaptor subunit n=1 Tax=Hyphomonas sp. TaxID=87 RepID=UPI003001287F
MSIPPMTYAETAPKPPFRLGLLIKRIVFLVLPVLVLIGSVGGFVLMGALKPAPEEKAGVIEALPVLTAVARSEPVTITVHGQGAVRARSEVSLAAEITGRVAYVSPNFLAGAQFKQGETLVRLESREYELGIVQAEAAVAQAKTALLQEISEGQIASQGAEQLGISQVSDLTLRLPQRAQAEAQLASAEASLDEARLQLNRTRIVAPFSGRVRQKSVNVGAYVSPGVQLGDIYASDVVEIALALTDADLANLGLGIGFSESSGQKGPPVALTATVAGVPHTWSGRITRTDSGFDPETRVLFAYVEVADPYGKGADNGTPLATGLYVDASIAGRALEESVVLPRTALRGKASVYVARDDDTLEIRPVSVAFSDRDRLVLTSGVAEGEKVVTSPVRAAASGMKIKSVDRLETAYAAETSAANE